jgi:hypothetical protein
VLIFNFCLLWKRRSLLGYAEALSLPTDKSNVRLMWSTASWRRDMKSNAENALSSLFWNPQLGARLCNGLGRVSLPA